MYTFVPFKSSNRSQSEQILSTKNTLVKEFDNRTRREDKEKSKAKKRDHLNKKAEFFIPLLHLAKSTIPKKINTANNPLSLLSSVRGEFQQRDRCENGPIGSNPF